MNLYEVLVDHIKTNICNKQLAAVSNEQLGVVDEGQLPGNMSDLICFLPFSNGQSLFHTPIWLSPSNYISSPYERRHVSLRVGAMYFPSVRFLFTLIFFVDNIWSKYYYSIQFGDIKRKTMLSLKVKGLFHKQRHCWRWLSHFLTLFIITHLNVTVNSCGSSLNPVHLSKNDMKGQSYLNLKCR